MTALPLWMQNLGALSLQVAILAAFSGALAYLAPLRDPKARLAFWQLMLLVCFSLPFAQPWKRIVVQRSVPAAVELRAPVAVQPLPVAPPAPVRVPTSAIVFYILAGGVALRLLWLAIGFYSLRRYRRTSRAFEPLPDPLRGARERLGVRADFLISDGIPGPITFGLLRPVILLPARVAAMTAAAQEAIACHELIHVRRRDWVWTALEEVVLGGLWFHPAVLWMVGQIRLAREQVVDSATVAITRSGREYVEALLAVAGFHEGILLSPAAPFLERRHLVERITSVLKEESQMSTKRIITRFALGLGCTLAVAGLAVSLFPVHAIVSPAFDQKEPVEIVSGGEYLLHGGHFNYPEGAIKQKVEGLVVAEVTTDSSGQVTDARILSGPEQLRKSALTGVLQLHFDPARQGAGVRQVTVSFRTPQLHAEENHGSPVRRTEGWIRERLSEVEEKLQKTTDPEAVAKLNKQKEELKTALFKGEVYTVALKMRDLKEPTGTVTRIKTDGVADAGSGAILANIGVHIGDSFDADKGKQVREALRKIDDHLRLRAERMEDGGIALIIIVEQ